jgi:tRNA(Ile)-lysidine synthase
MNPNFDETLKRVASRLENVNDLLLDAVEAFKTTWKKSLEFTSIPLGEKFNPEVLYYSFAEFGFNYDAILSLLELVENKSIGKKIISATHGLYLDREELRLILLKETFTVDVVLGFGDTSFSQGKINIERVESIDKSQMSEHVQFFDATKFEEKIRLRTWREGDNFKPLGMKGKQKVSDFLINNKVALNEKKEILVLTVDGKIAWLIGHRISEDFKVKDFDAVGLKISYKRIS